MKNILIVALGILVLFVLGNPAHAQTLTSDKFVFLELQIVGSLYIDNADELSSLQAVIVPKKILGQWTFIFNNDFGTILTTNPVYLRYVPKTVVKATANE